MPPITWRNVDAPNLGDPTRTLALAQSSFNTALDQFGKPLQQMEQTNQANWNAAKENNTNEMLNYLSGFKSVEDAQAAINNGSVQNMLTRMGAQVDQTKVRQAQTNVIPDLQQRYTQGIAYDNTKAAESEKPIVGALMALLPDAKNRAHLAQAAQQYQEAGMLRPTVVADLLDKARNYGRNDDEWQLKLNADARAKQALQIQQEEAKARRQELDARTKAFDRQLKQQEQSQQQASLEALIASRAEVNQKGVYGDGDMATVEGKNAFYKALADTYKLSDNAINDVRQNFDARYPQGKYEVHLKNPDGSLKKDTSGKPMTEMVPIPVRTLLSSVGRTDEIWNGSLWSRRGDKTANQFSLDMQKQEVMDEILGAYQRRDRDALSILQAAQDAADKADQPLIIPPSGVKASRKGR